MCVYVCMYVLKFNIVKYPFSATRFSSLFDNCSLFISVYALRVGICECVAIDKFIHSYC